MRATLLLLCLLPAVFAAFSVYRATPNVFIKPPFPNTKLLVDELVVALDTDAGLFYINSTEYYSDSNTAHELPFTLLYGNLSFTEEGYIQFSYPNRSALYCVQARSSPSMCDFNGGFNLQSYTDGPFVFSAAPSLAAPVVLVIQTSSMYVDPSTGSPYNFFYAPQGISLTCTSGTCASLANVVPPAPLPEDATFTVRRRLHGVPLLAEPPKGQCKRRDWVIPRGQGAANYVCVEWY